MKKHTLFITVLLVLLAFAMVTCAHAETSGDYEYVLQRDGNAKITSYTGNEPGMLNIPSVLDGHDVATIAENAFQNSKISGVTIPSTVTSIEAYAFDQCVNIRSIRIPNNVIYLSGNPFTGCSSLTVINVPNNHPTLAVTSDGILYNSKRFELICYPCAYSNTKFDIPQGTLSISKAAFYGCANLKNINLPNTLTTIGDYAFATCTGLTSIKIPDTVTTIGNSAFSECDNLQSVKLSGQLSAIKNNTFYGCRSLATPVIPSSVTEIGSAAFMLCTSMTSLKIPDSVIEIGKKAFYRCSNLGDITVPASVTIIGEDAFEDCNIQWFRAEPNSYPFLYGNINLYRVTDGTNDNFLTGN